MAKSTKLVLPLIENPEDTANPNRLACQKCALFKDCQFPFAQVYIPDSWTGKILLIDETPSIGYGGVMTGKTGSILRNAWQNAGFKDTDIAITNACRCGINKDVSPTLTQSRMCRPFVVHDVLCLRPEWVVGLGDVVLKAIFNSGSVQMKKSRQRQFQGEQFFGTEGKDVQVAFTYHPASCLYKQGAEFRERLQADFLWLHSFSGYRKTPETKTPTGSVLGLDIEWDKDYKLLTVGVSDTNSAIATEDKNQWEQWLPDICQSTEPESHLVGHSVFGDQTVLRLNGVNLSSKLVSGEKVTDTLLTTRLANENRGSYDLESLSAALCGTRPWKSDSELLMAKI